MVQLPSGLTLRWQNESNQKLTDKPEDPTWSLCCKLGIPQEPAQEASWHPPGLLPSLLPAAVIDPLSHHTADGAPL